MSTGYAAWENSENSLLSHRETMDFIKKAQEGTTGCRHFSRKNIALVKAL